jgi:hypothetical protein
VCSLDENIILMILIPSDLVVATVVVRGVSWSFGPTTRPVVHFLKKNAVCVGEREAMDGSI